jgi:hypothetical protein
MVEHRHLSPLLDTRSSSLQPAASDRRNQGVAGQRATQAPIEKKQDTRPRKKTETFCPKNEAPHDVQAEKETRGRGEKDHDVQAEKETRGRGKKDHDAQAEKETHGRGEKDHDANAQGQKQKATQTNRRIPSAVEK